MINISSLVGKYGNIGQSNYAASKAGVVAMTQTAAKEFGKFGIRINAVLPGFINTPIVQTIPDKVKQMMVKMTPLGRMGEPEGQYLYKKRDFSFLLFDFGNTNQNIF